MSDQVKHHMVWLPDGYGGGEHTPVVKSSDYDALRIELEKLKAQPASVAAPEGWSVNRVDPEDGFGYIIQSPRIGGVSSGTAVWSDSENPAERMLAFMLAAAPHPVSGERRPVEMADIVNALEAVPGSPMLSSNMCHLIAQAINERRAQQAKP